MEKGCPLQRVIKCVGIILLLFSSLNLGTVNAQGNVYHESTRSYRSESEPSSQSSSGLITYIGTDKNIWLISPDGSGERQLTTQGNYSEPTWSPDCSSIAYIQIITASNGKQANQIGLLSIKDSSEKIIISPEKTPFVLLDSYYWYSNPRWSPDGESLFFIAFDGRIQGSYVRKFSLVTKKYDSNFPQFMSRGFDISSTDQNIVTKDYQNAIPVGDGLYLYNPTGTLAGTILPVGEGGVYNFPYWLPNGQQVAFVDYVQAKNTYTLVLINRDGSNQTTLFSDSSMILLSFSISPNGKNAVVDTNGSLQIIDLETKRAHVLVNGTSPDWGIAPLSLGGITPAPIVTPSPEATQPPSSPASGGLIAYVGKDGNIRLVNPESFDTVQLTFDGHPLNKTDIVVYFGIRWSPDGRLLGATRYSSQGNSIVIIQLSDRTARTLLSDVEGSFDWLPDSESIIYSTGPKDESKPSGLAILNIKNGNKTTFLSPPSDLTFTDPDWADQGEYVLFAARNYPIVQGMSPYIMGISKSPGGEYIIVQNTSLCDWRPSGDQLICQEGIRPSLSLWSPLVVFSTSGEKLGEIPGGMANDFLSYPHWSPDGNYLAYHWQSPGISKSNTLEVVQVSGMSSTLTLMIEGLYFPLDWSPDSKTLLASKLDDQLVLIDVQSGSITTLATSVALVPYNPDVWQPIQLRPTPITDLQASPGPSGGQVTLSWTTEETNKPGISPVTGYEIRYGNEPITESNWGNAAPLPNPPAPNFNAPWTPSITFSLNTQWYFAIKTVDGNGNKSEISNISWIIDTGFRPKPNGFQFCNGPVKLPCDTGWMNYPTPPSNMDFTMDDMRKMFGDSTVCKSIDQNNICTPYTAAELWNENANKSTLGHCYGMAVAAEILSPGQHYFGDDKPELNALHLKSNQTYNLTLDQSRRPITYLFMYQFTNPIRRYIDEKESLSIKENIDNIKLSMTTKPLDPVVLIMEKGNQGHALSPYAIEKHGNGATWIWVYDNDHPNESNRMVQISPTSNWWTYNMGDSVNIDYWGSSKGFDLGSVPISLHQKQAEPIWMIFDHDFFWIAGDGHILIRNDQNQLMGFSNGQYINSIPNASYHAVIANQENGSEPIYTVPNIDTYTITLFGNQSPGYSSITRFSGQSVSSVDDIPTNSNTKDVLLFYPDNTQIDFNASETKSITFTFALDEEVNSYKLQIRNVDIKKGESVSLKSDMNHRILFIINRDGSNGVYDITLTHLDQTRKQQFIFPAIEIATHQTQEFDYSKGNLTSVILKTDQNSDGQYEIEKILNAQTENVPGIDNLTSSHIKISPVTWIGIFLAIVGFIIILFVAARLIYLRKQKGNG